MAAATALLAGQATAQRVMDKLDRGMVAVKTTGGVYTSWRVFGEDADNVLFNVYRDGTKLNAEPLRVSNYFDASGNISSTYTVKPVVKGVEQAASKAAVAMANNYLQIPVAAVPSNKDGRDISADYEPNDATVADLDGDGNMEVLIKMRYLPDHANNYPNDQTDFDIIQAYRLDGTLMWWIDCGRNMVDYQSNEINIAAYDWDGDGRAECVLRGADGMVIHQADGTKTVVGNPNANTRPYLVRSSNMQYTNTGAEYLLYIDGLTAKPYSISTYPLPRLEAGENDVESAWGDGYGHRSSKHFFGAPYFDGRKPSLFLARGIYTRHKMVCYDINPQTHELVERWRWADNKGWGSPWYGQGYHNYSIADVDWDGRDEIVFGSMVIDDNGRGLSTTGLGHGDAHHVGDFNPYAYGSEIGACNEDHPSNNFRDATSSKIYYRKTDSADDGRCMTGNFTNQWPGGQFFSAHDGATLISCVSAKHIDQAGNTGQISQNFRLFWDGDLLDETFNGSQVRNSDGVIYKYGKGAIATFSGTLTNNDTKATPCFTCDIFGDWREEVIMRSADNHSFRIYTTTIPTEHRIYTLLHDPQYRNAVLTQMNGYNQPPHPSFFVGELEGITQAPPAPTMTGRTELTDGQTLPAGGADKSWIMAATQNASATVAEGAAPELFVDNAPSWVQGRDNNNAIYRQYYTHTLTGGAFAGETKIVKLGAGRLVLPSVEHKHSGETQVWDGTVALDGTLLNSRLWLNRFAKFETNGAKLPKGLEMNYASELHIGSDNTPATVEVSDLKLNMGAKVYFDVFTENNTADHVVASAVSVEKKTWEHGPEYMVPVFVIVPHLAAGVSAIPEGKYLLATVGSVTGNVGDIVLEGLGGRKGSLVLEGNKLYLSVAGTREATDVVWTGSESAVWDFAETPNFAIRATGEPTVFVNGDRVTFDDSAVSTTITVASSVSPASVTFNNSEKALTVQGESIDGNCNLEKKGTGRVVIKNVNGFKGNVTIYNGAIEGTSFGCNEGQANGALGHYTNTVTLTGGGILAAKTSLKSSHPITVTEIGGIEVASGATFTVAAAAVSGTDATLVKSGAGQINFTKANNLAVLRLDGGSVYDEGDTHVLGRHIVLNGSNVQLIHLNNSYSYNTNSSSMEVPEFKTAKMHLDGRCDYKGKLYGKGRLEVLSNYVRNFLMGDWSEFEGQLVATQNSGSNFDFYNEPGLPKATLNISAGSYFRNTESQYNRCKNENMPIGALTGNGTLSGKGNYRIGTNNANSTFSGYFDTGIGMVKEGTGKLSITKPSPAMGSVVVNSGELNIRMAETEAGSALGTKALVVNGGELSGCGVLGNSSVTVSNASIRPSTKSASMTFRKLTLKGNLVMDAASTVAFELGGATKYGSIDVKGSLDCQGKAVVTLIENYVPKVGDTFTLWTAARGTAMPQLQLPELPAGMAWDTSAVSMTSGVITVAEGMGIDDIAADTQLNCTVYNAKGIAVMHFTAAKSQIEEYTSTLASGVYVVAIEAPGIKLSQKVVVK